MKGVIQKIRKRDPVEVARLIVRIAQDPDPRLRRGQASVVVPPGERAAQDVALLEIDVVLQDESVLLALSRAETR